MSEVFRRDGVYFPRFWWRFPWHCTRWWMPRIWRGGDEWCNRPLVIDVPLAGSFLFFQFWKPLRVMPCDECWAVMCDEQRADYLPGGRYVAGRVHEDRPFAWERTS